VSERCSATRTTRRAAARSAAPHRYLRPRPWSRGKWRPGARARSSRPRRISASRPRRIAWERVAADGVWGRLRTLHRPLLYHRPGQADGSCMPSCSSARGEFSPWLRVRDGRPVGQWCAHKCTTWGAGTTSDLGRGVVPAFEGAVDTLRESTLSAVVSCTECLRARPDTKEERVMVIIARAHKSLYEEQSNSNLISMRPAIRSARTIYQRMIYVSLFSSPRDTLSLPAQKGFRSGVRKLWWVSVLLRWRSTAI